MAKRRKPGSGRVPQLTPEVSRIICEQIAVGVPDKYAAASAGVKPSTLMAWKRQGAIGRKSLYTEFLEAYKKAAALRVSRNLLLIQKTALDGTWTAAAWLLERLDPEHFGTDRRELRELRKLVADLTAKVTVIASHDHAPPPTPPSEPSGASD